VTIQDARAGSFVVLDWWTENMILQRLWLNGDGDPDGLVPATPTDRISCVWELAVAGHEREAWVDAVLRSQWPLAGGLSGAARVTVPEARGVSSRVTGSAVRGFSRMRQPRADRKQPTQRRPTRLPRRDATRRCYR
jgi:hypothetical protein